MRLWEQYLQPASLDEALAALRAASGPAALVAGGTDLLLDLDQGRHQPVHTLVDVSRVPEMLRIESGDGWIQVGAAAPLSAVIANPLIVRHGAALREASQLIGGPQVRNVATLGGNVAHALPAGDGTIALLALGAEAELATPEGRSWVELEQLFDRPGVPAFDRVHEILVRFRFPELAAGEASAFRRIMRPQGVAIAILNMSARLRVAESGLIESLRLAIGPAGPRPLRARGTEAVLLGRRLDRQAGELALGALEAEVSLRTSPHRATAEYRRHLLGMLLDQTLDAAARGTGRI